MSCWASSLRISPPPIRRSGASSSSGCWARGIRRLPALKWSDLLEIKAEEPINLWPKAAETYHRWVRDSYNLVMSALVAGGGFQAGKVVGESDEEGRYVKSRPIYPWDLWESVYQLLGIDPNDKLPNPDGCVAYVSPATACCYARRGILKEIM